jgi:Sulfotransferase domain
MRNSMNDRIEFIGVGVAKSGTTWFMKVLEQHPDICISSKKEINYFNVEFMDNPTLKNQNYSKGLNSYHSFFKHALPGQKRGEFSPCYFNSQSAYKDIHQYNPDIKLFAILRDPLSRNISDYRFHVQLGMISPNISFEESLIKFPFYYERSNYFKIISRFLTLFPREQFQIILLEDLKNDRENTFRKFEDYLGVSHYDDFQFDFKSNVTKNSKYPMLNHIINIVRVFLNREPMLPLKHLIRKLGISDAAELVRDKINIKDEKNDFVISEETKNMVRESYREDILKLSDFLGRDLSHWLNP